MKFAGDIAGINIIAVEDYFFLQENYYMTFWTEDWKQ